MNEINLILTLISVFLLGVQIGVLIAARFLNRQ